MNLEHQDKQNVDLLAVWYKTKFGSQNLATKFGFVPDWLDVIQRNPFQNQDNPWEVSEKHPTAQRSLKPVRVLRNNNAIITLDAPVIWAVIDRYIFFIWWNVGLSVLLSTIRHDHDDLHYFINEVTPVLAKPPSNFNV